MYKFGGDSGKQEKEAYFMCFTQILAMDRLQISLSVCTLTRT